MSSEWNRDLKPFLSDFDVVSLYNDGDMLVYKDDHIECVKGGQDQSTRAQTQQVAQKIFQDLHDCKALIDHLSVDQKQQCISQVIEHNMNQVIQKIKVLKLESYLSPENHQAAVKDLLYWEQVLQTTQREAKTPKALERKIPTAAQASEVLEISTQPTVSDSLRAKLTPKSTGAGTANGTYFIFVPPEGVELNRVADSEINKGFVAKPASQEAGNIGNPQGIPQPLRRGIPEGGGVIRERMAYSIQNALQADLGIPPTEIISTSHPVFSEEVGQMTFLFNELIKILNLQGQIDITKEIANNKSLNTPAQICSFIFQKLAEIEAEPITAIYNLLMAEGNDISKNKLLRNTVTRGLVSQNPQLIQILPQLAHYLTKEQCSPVAVSIQVFVPDCVTYMDLGSDINLIPDEEMHKLCVDLIIFNTDRHMNNILFKRTAEKTEVILIDHGSSLPAPTRAGYLDHGARYEWFNYPQFERPLCEKFAGKISQLDISSFIPLLQADQQKMEAQFGKNCALSEEEFKLVHLNLIALKVGIRLGKSVKDCALFHMPIKTNGDEIGGEIVAVYEKHLEGKAYKQIDWNAAEKEIESIFSGR